MEIIEQQGPPALEDGRPLNSSAAKRIGGQLTGVIRETYRRHVQTRYPGSPEHCGIPVDTGPPSDGSIRCGCPASSEVGRLAAGRDRTRVDRSNNRR